MKQIAGCLKRSIKWTSLQSTRLKETKEKTHLTKHKEWKRSITIDQGNTKRVKGNTKNTTRTNVKWNEPMTQKAQTTTTYPIWYKLKSPIGIWELALNKMKYLRVNLTKHVQDVYAENYKMLVKEIKEELNKWRGRAFMDRDNQSSQDVRPP